MGESKIFEQLNSPEGESVEKAREAMADVIGSFEDNERLVERSERNANNYKEIMTKLIDSKRKYKKI